MQDGSKARRIKLTVAYDGTNYSGFQLQKNAKSIEEVLNDSISKALGEDIKIIGASRTDAGVHARGNVAVFDTDARMPGDKFSFCINQKLPKDIVITSSEEVSRQFHPRYRRTRKTYEYTILNDTHKDPTRRLYTAYCYPHLDLEKMKEGAVYLLGRHDFASFCSAKSQIESTVREVESLTLEKSGNEIVMRITGDGFLYHMVRLIAGVLMRVGFSYYPPSEVKNILEKKERGYARPVAPACGLSLISIEYPEDRCPWAKTELSVAYHDKDWGVPVHDDRKLFELLILEGQQAGLSWETILKKKSAMYHAFAEFDPEKVVLFDKAKIEELMQNEGIIRNRRKLEALVKNAKAFLALQEECGSFDAYIWNFVGGEPLVNLWKTMEEVPAHTELSDRISKDLKKRGFSFVGSTIIYSFLQSAGLVNDHLVSCFRHGELRDFYEIYEPEK